jgi:DNA-binding MarR family transcriptional regulator
MQRAGNDDRRERRLFVTAKGGRLAEKLSAQQIQHIENALGKAGPGAAEFARRFLFAMITESDRLRVEALVKLASGTRA